MFGEVSPALRFATDLASYSRALSRLVNGFVRKAGGVSNRSGFKHLTESHYQDSIKTPGSKAGLRVFAFEIGEKRYVAEMDAEGWNAGSLQFRDLDNPGTTYIPTGVVPVSAISFAFGNLEYTRISFYDDLIIFQNWNQVAVFAIQYVDNPAIEFKWSNLSSPVAVGAPSNPTNASPVGSGNPPTDIPVAYLIMQEKIDGAEVRWGSRGWAEGHPHTQLSAFFTNAVDISSGVKQYNIYRSVNTGGVEGASWGLVGRLPRPTASPITFEDFLPVADYTVQPPLSRRLYGAQTGSPAPSAIHYLQFARFVLHYQQRRIVVFAGANISGDLPEGTIGVSKLGVPQQMDAPTTPNSVDAFEFQIPLELRGHPITAGLAMDRLILFTDNATVAIMGDEAGILTPLTVNPRILTHEGCSPIVPPVSTGRRGFFINHDHTKLMGITFRSDNSVEVQDISSLHDHLMEDQDVVEMQVLKGVENIVVLLRNDGTALTVTVNDELEVTGWARLETDGLIESMSKVSRPPDFTRSDRIVDKYEALVISVIRSGTRRLEVLTQRRDKDPDEGFYADSCVAFGQQLLFNHSIGAYENPLLNIEGGTTWSADETLTVKNIASALPEHPATAFDATWLDKRIDFFYDHVDTVSGKTVVRRLRFTPLTVVSATELTGRFDDEVPTSLRNVQGQLGDKTLKQSRWLPAINKVSNALTNLKSRYVSVYADGMVVASPLNPAFEKLQVSASGNNLDLPDFFNFGYVGLPYGTTGFEAETLDLDTADERTFTDATKLVNQVGIAFRNTKGGMVGQTGSGSDPENLMGTVISRENEAVEELTEIINGHILVPFPGTWEKTGRVLIRQVDPMPMTVLAVYPKGMAGA